jgi:hypothetical protein
MYTLLGFLFTSCETFLPDNLDNLGSDSRFTQITYSPVLGRNTLMDNNFLSGNASQPLKFKIVDIRRFNGDEAPELTDVFPVSTWIQPYLGNEISLQEIESKRAIQNKPLFNIREHNGSLEMWSLAKSSFVHTAPDSGYVFDVEVSNSGGRKYFNELRLKPYRERPYEPSNLDAVTGNAKNPFVRLTSMFNVRGDRTGGYMGTGEAEVYFRKVVDNNGQDIGSGNTIKFIFKDSLDRTINPNKFNETKWENLVHGFDMQKTDNYVQYKVAFPIPLSSRVTNYTNASGTLAKTTFAYSRLGFGNIRQDASLNFDFAIYEKGDWEIIIVFPRESPKFIND